MTADELAQAAAKLVDDARTGTWIECPDCCGTKGHERIHADCGGQGCALCNRGMIFTPCNTCGGEGEVYKMDDEDLDCYWDYPVIDGMKQLSNWQMKKEGK